LVKTLRCLLLWLLQAGSAVLDATSCFITDGNASALLSSSSSSSATSTTAPANGTAASTQQLTPATTSQQQQQQQQSTWQLPLCQQPQQTHRLDLIKGHLPPSKTMPEWLTRRALQAHPISSSSSSIAGSRKYVANPVAEVLRNSLGLMAGQQEGLRQLQNYMQHQDQQQRQGVQGWMEMLQQAHQEQQQQQQQQQQQEGQAVALGDQQQQQQEGQAGALGDQQQQQQEEARQSASYNSQIQQQRQLPMHMLLLPVPAPPGSVAALSHPWPPQLLPGFNGQGLQGPGQGIGCGQLHRPGVLPKLLRVALTRQEPSLVLRGVAGSAETVEALLVSLFSVGV
jgi:hypothetical protein